MTQRKMDHDYGLQWSTERIEEIQWALKGQVCQSPYKNVQGIAMFLLAYNVSIDEHRSVQYTIEQYSEIIRKALACTYNGIGPQY